MMPDSPETTIPSANTPAEINIHLGYIRRDILDMKRTTSDSLQEIKTQISDLDDHYVNESQFVPLKESHEQLIIDVRNLTEWKDTFNGKMIGFGIGISVATSVVTFVLTYFLKQ